jgi:ubiquinone/menaquinone biosynthesis C-methylase UbiE
LQHGGNLSHFEDNSFDIVTATFVLHGMKAEKRSKVLQEMKRVARQQVVIHDYYGPTEPVARFLEFLEKSDYKNFKKQFPMEMQAHFTETTLLNGVRGRALYIGTV